MAATINRQIKEFDEVRTYMNASYGLEDMCGQNSIVDFGRSDDLLVRGIVALFADEPARRFGQQP